MQRGCEIVEQSYEIVSVAIQESWGARILEQNRFAEMLFRPLVPERKWSHLGQCAHPINFVDRGSVKLLNSPIS